MTEAEEQALAEASHASVDVIIPQVQIVTDSSEEKVHTGYRCVAHNILRLTCMLCYS